MPFTVCQVDQVSGSNPGVCNNLGRLLQSLWTPGTLAYMMVHNIMGVRVSIFPIVVCVRSTYVISAGIGFRVKSGAVALLQLNL